MTRAATLSFDLILGTLGRRPNDLRRCVESIVGQGRAECRLVIVDQSPDGGGAALATEYANRLDIRYRTSAPGLSRARNVGLSESTADVVAFPDDDCEYPPGLLDRIATELVARDDVSGISVRVLTPAGTPTLVRWGRRGGRIHRRSVWRQAVSPGIFLRRQLVDVVGLMDEQLGLGAGTPWGSGEETDYLIRALDLGFPILYLPDLHVVHPDRGASERSAALGRKYGRGMGFVLGKNAYPVTALAIHCGRPLLGAALKSARGRIDEARFHAAVAHGRQEGWRAARRRR